MKIKKLLLWGYVFFLVLLAGILLPVSRSLNSLSDARVVFWGYLIILTAVSLLWLALNTLFFKGKEQTDPNRDNAIALIAWLIMFLWMPAAGLISGMEAALPNSENRPLAAFPQLKNHSLGSFLQESQSYLGDRLGFRKASINMNNYIQLKYLRHSPVDYIIKGKNDWLFFTPSLNDTLGVSSISPDGLPGLTGRIEHQCQWAEDQGILFLLVICPNKESIYPEYIPSPWLINRNGQSNTDAILSSISPKYQKHILDLRQTFKEAKGSGQLFYRTDTHWNDYGALVAYCAIMQKLDVRVPAVSEFTIQENARLYSGDLVNLLAIQNQITEMAPNVISTPFAAPVPGIKRVVIHHDSFYNTIAPFFLRDFQQVDNFWFSSGFDPLTLEDDPPDILITLCVERQVGCLFPGRVSP